MSLIFFLYGFKLAIWGIRFLRLGFAWDVNAPRNVDSDMMTVTMMMMM